MTGAPTIDRFLLGTVQLGIPYGRTRPSGLMSESRAFELLEAAWEIGVREFDTAEAYGVSAVRLAGWLKRTGRLHSAHIVTKISAALEIGDVRAAASEAIARFDAAGGLTLLAHGVPSAALWAEIESAADSAGVRAGQSVYDAAEVAAAWELPGVDTVQAPANVFDSRAMIAPPGVGRQMHYRSAYLQGVLLETPENAERRAPGAGDLVAAVASAASSVAMPPAPLLLAAVLRASRSVDRIVVGVDTAADLHALPQALQVPRDVVDEFIRLVSLMPVTNDTVLDPRCWASQQ